jgi:glyoxylase-like metal-dependent hydrolase (beta-lactamase superfamily II)
MAASIPFRRAMSFDYGAADRLSPLIRRVVARNPSAFTFHGTGTYIVGRGEVAVIDPGPALDDHIDALLAAVAGERVSHILVTHTHSDHSPAARRLQAETGAATYGFGPHGSRCAGPRVEEGADYAFAPDIRLADGGRLEGPGWTFEAVHTPGHTSNHLCFALEGERVLFPGDHVMGWSTTVVSPPDGDMHAYMASLEKLLARDDALYWPTHGPSIPEPAAYVRALLAHRHDREHQIAGCLAAGTGCIEDMVARMYADVPRALHAAAAQTVLSHLIHMMATGRAQSDGPPGLDARYRAA